MAHVGGTYAEEKFFISALCNNEKLAISKRASIGNDDFFVSPKRRLESSLLILLGKEISSGCQYS